MRLVLTKSSEGGRFVTTGSACFGGKPINVHEEGATNMRTLAEAATGMRGNAIDAHFWLPMAAEALNISRKIKDYVVVPNVPIIISDVPNTNGVAFSKEQLMKFNARHGRMGYKTFKGKPTFEEHANSDIWASCGVILDVYLQKLERHGHDLISVVELLAFDRSKVPDLANAILRKERNCYSMGALFQSFSMSDGSPATKSMLNKPLYVNANNELVYKLVEDIEGFETSSVANPAYAAATNEVVFSLA